MIGPPVLASRPVSPVQPRTHLLRQNQVPVVGYLARTLQVVLPSQKAKPVAVGVVPGGGRLAAA